MNELKAIEQNIATLNAIYPEIEVSHKSMVREKYGISIETNLRKLHTDGKWYLQKIIESMEYTDPALSQKFIRNFYENVYANIILGVVALEIKFIRNGKEEFAYILDPDQRSEVERLSELIMTNSLTPKSSGNSSWHSFILPVE